MSEPELSEKYLSEIAGWEAMKQARAFVEQGKVLSAQWNPPVIQGIVEGSGASYRAGLVLKRGFELENLCTCRDSRQWGKVCAHSVAVGLHYLRPASAQTPEPKVEQQHSKPEEPLRAPFLDRSIDPDAEKAAVHLIFPQNFTQPGARVTIYFEIERNKKRGSLGHLPKNSLLAFDEFDNRLLDILEEWSPGVAPAFLAMSGEKLARLISLLTGHPRVSVGRGRMLRISDETWSPDLAAELQKDGRIVLRAEGLRDAEIVALPGGSRVLIAGQEFRPLGLPPLVEQVLLHPITIERNELPIFLNQIWPELQKSGRLKTNFGWDDFEWEALTPKFRLELAGGMAQLTARLEVRYPNGIGGLAGAGGRAGWLADPANPRRYLVFDPAAEQQAIGLLRQAGFLVPNAQGNYELKGEEAVLRFFARYYQKFQTLWDVVMEERLQKSQHKHLEFIQPNFTVISSGIEWFDLQVNYTSGSGEILSPADLQRLLLSGRSHARLKNGKLGLIDADSVEEWQETLRDASPQQVGSAFRLGREQSGFVAATIGKMGHLKAPAQWLERSGSQTGSIHFQPPALGRFDDILRDYQKKGVAWMHFLWKERWSGLLADEMGLGKTVQTLAYLATLPVEARRPSLVICPTSLVYNWEREAQRFTPEFRVLVLQGPSRASLIEKIAEADLVITSYALARRDAEKYGDMEFGVIVLDEAQHIKNRESQNATAVKSLRARQRLVLTGTPVENSVVDVWSIFDFLMPGYLGTAKEFKDRYEIPIMKERSKEAQARLVRRVKPFLLRRTKKEVASDLPAKLEQVVYCDLSQAQRIIYEQVLSAGRQAILQSAGVEAERGKNKILIFNTLLRLRQICCDARLIGSGETLTDEHSGKLEMCGELLDEVIDGGHRVLIFSQFVGMLKILKDRLEASNISYCYLDGSTLNRGEVVDRFQRDANLSAFLISLKAGGSGLNLTGADTVIHYDPWWNPAVEAQATDRAHRIGQTRVVTSYKLIAKGTVEEKILQLQERKRELIAATLDSEEAVLESLTWEELRGLLD